MSTDDTIFKKLEFLLVKVMMTSGDFSELIGFENLLGLLNYFPSAMKQKLCEKMMIFIGQKDAKMNDGFMIHAVLQVAKTLHDRIDFETEEFEVKRVSNMIIAILSKVDHGRDLDKTLSVFTEARGLFINLDKVNIALIQYVLNLAIKCNCLVKG